MSDAASIAQALRCGHPHCACGSPSRRSPRGLTWRTHCPAHGDDRPSLDVTETPDGKVLVICRSAGCGQTDVIAALRTRNLWAATNEEKCHQRERIVAAYDYRDENGELLFQVVRCAPKTFYQRRPARPDDDPKDIRDGWVWNIKGITRVLYRLPELLKSRGDVFVPEGERDVETLRTLGFTATTNSGGAKKWRREYSDSLKGRHVVLIPDNDEAGEKHMKLVAESLRGIAASVRIVHLDDGKDVTEWVERGHSAEDLRQIVSLQKPESGDEKDSQTKIILSQVHQTNTEFFHDPNDIAYAALMIDGRRETWPLRSRGFKAWLSRLYFMATGQAPTATAIDDVVRTCEGEAWFGGPDGRGILHDVYTRIGTYGGVIYLDLADPAWRAVAISKDEWHIVNNPPVYFRRSSGMKALPVPVPGNLNDLRRFLNTSNDADWVLAVSWLVAAVRDRGPYPVLVLRGDHGSAKSTTARVLRSIIDPNSADLRSEPREPRDLMMAAVMGWVVNLDNISKLQSWLSDSLCRLATGAGQGGRKYYTDDEETLYQAQRPIIINGIEEVATRPDLLDRTLILVLHEIDKRRRMSERKFWREFEGARPALLGGLLTVVAGALARLDDVVLKGYPRMADFAEWATAAEQAHGWELGTFMAVYEQTRVKANAVALESSMVAPYIDALVPKVGDTWEATSAKLLERLNEIASEAARKHKEWPTTARALRSELSRIRPNLRQEGIWIAFEPGKGKERNVTVVVIERTEGPDIPPRRAEGAATATSATTLTSQARQAWAASPSALLLGIGVGADSDSPGRVEDLSPLPPSEQGNSDNNSDGAEGPVSSPVAVVAVVAVETPKPSQMDAHDPDSATPALNGDGPADDDEGRRIYLLALRPDLQDWIATASSIEVAAAVETLLAEEEMSGKQIGEAWGDGH